jgi:hypothetical protein
VWDANERLGGDGETNAQETRSTRRQAGEAEGMFLKRCTGTTTVRKRQKSEQKKRKTQYESKKSRKPIPRVKRRGVIRRGVKRMDFTLPTKRY